MTANNFIPQLWAAQLLVNLQHNLVYGQSNVVNTDYQGEITGAGSSVVINNVGRVSVGDYAKNTDMPAAENITTDDRILTIDQQKFFNFQVDDVDKVQSAVSLMNGAMYEASYALKNAIDTYLAAKYTEAANTIGTDSAPETVDQNTAYEALVDLSVKLDEADVPEQGRYVIVPPWFEGLMLKDDRFVKAGNLNADQRLLNGTIGQAAGFTVLKSNNVPVLPDGKTYHIQAGHPIAETFAHQFMNMEAYRIQQRFADAVKGLCLHGAKVTRPDALAVLTVTRPS